MVSKLGVCYDDKLYLELGRGIEGVFAAFGLFILLRSL
jgi:hypothetical protein